MAAQIGDEVGITYDWDGEGPPPAPGAGLVTATGRCYLITEARRVRSRVHPRRFALRAAVIELADAPELLLTLSWGARHRT
jgi:hypothetical protein